MIELRPYQIRSVNGVFASLKSGHRCPMLMVPARGGKTVIAGKIVEMGRKKSKKALFVAPLSSLVDQTIDSFEANGIRVGAMQANHPKTNMAMPIQVASAQTLAQREIPDFDILFVDEAHIVYRHMAELIKSCGKPVIGLSATPWSRGLAQIYDDLVVGSTIKELMDDEYLCPARVFAPSTPDLSQVETVAGEFNKGQLEKAMDRPQLVGDIVENWIKHAEGRSTMVFAVDRNHARSIWTQFNAAGISAAYVDGTTEREDRRFVKEEFHAGEYKIVINVGVFKAGADWPGIRCIIDAKPTKSEMDFVQRNSRGLTPDEGKTDCLLFDHAGNHLRLGFVADIHHGRLHDGGEHGYGPEAPRERLPKLCPQCQAVKQAGVRKCASCGFEAAYESRVRVAEGELVEFDGHKQRVPLAKKQVVTHAVKQAWYSSLLWIQRERGYKQTYAAAVYRDKFGVWPRGLHECPIYPDSVVLSWIRSRQIARAKARSAHPVAAE